MANDTKVMSLCKAKKSHEKIEQQLVVHLQVYGPMTRLGFSERIGRSVNCVTAAVKALLDAGILTEHEQVTEPSTGRKAWTLSLRGAQG